MRMAARQAWQGWRAGEFNVLLAALFVAVLALAGVGSIAQRTTDALAEQSRRLVGGDAAFSSDAGNVDAAERDAKRLGLAMYRSVELSSMVGSTKATPQLGTLKALAGDAPLLGAYRVRTARGVELLPRPNAGEAWLSSSGAQRMRAAIGERITVGGRTLVMTGIVVEEPDRPLNGVELGPRVILPLAEVETGGLLGPGARASWRVSVAGAPAAIAQWVKAREADPTPGARVETGDDISPQLRSRTGSRATVPVGLAGADRGAGGGRDRDGLAPACGAPSPHRRHLPRAWRTPARHRRPVCRHAGAARRHRDHRGVGRRNRAAIRRRPVDRARARHRVACAARVALLQGALVGGWILLTFALPPLLALRRVSALAVLRSDLRTPSPPALVLFGLALAGMLAMFWQAAGNPQAAAILLGGLLATAAILAVAGGGLAWLVARAGRSGSGITRYALLNLARRRRLTIAQVVALGTSLMALLLLLLVRTDVWEQWQATVRGDAPNRFVINVQPEQRATFDATLQRLGFSSAGLSPMIRGRYIGPTARERGRPQPEGRGERLMDREFNLSTADTLPEGNTLKAGTFWDAKTARNQFSVETKFAEQLQWKLGDTLVFDVAGQRIEGRITSLRDVRWESFTPNFFVLASPDLAPGLPATYITAVRVPRGDATLATALSREIPNANVIDIDAVTGEIARIGDQAAMVIQVVFWFAFLSGCLVFVAAVAATRDERITELGVLRTLGASTAQLRRSQLVEFGAIGAIAGSIAALAAAGIGSLFAQRVLDLPPTWSPTTLATGAIVGTVAAMLAGWLSMRRQLHATVRDTLGMSTN
jgi:putative ABC transport system permease protein